MKNNYRRMLQKCMIILVLGLFNLASAQKKVIAYIPNWIDLNAFSSTIQYSKLTHINIAFENPDANGYLSFNSGSNAIINAAHAQNIKVFVSLGGGSVSEGGAIRDNYFNLITPANRTAFIQKIYDYVVAHNFDGVDVDLEGPAINGDYGGFVIALANKLHANGKLISAALSEGYGGANVPSSTFAAYDWINIMAYDATGPWAPGNPGQHSPYSMAVNQFNYWTGRGLPASKAIIGLPFYGYGFGASANQGISYANIVAQYPGAENLDQVGNTIYYNGIPTIKQKTTFAVQNAGGVMIWELSQDATGAKSLLTAVDQVVKGSNPPTGTGTLIQAENYNTMSGVQTEATTDTGGGLNVGYCDTGDWMAYYNINFPTSGNYIIEYRVASAVTGGRLSSDLNAGTIQLGAVNVPNTGGWQNWQTITQTVNVNAGTYNFGIYVQNTGFNINWFRITKAASGLAAKSASADKIESLTVYPNPSEDTLFFSAEVSGANVSIINSEGGATVSTQKANDNSINVSGLKSGIYLILVEKDGIKTVRRFIKK
ncbi:glycosyl hydrolase family 18 protein [Flavobacterium johnsoniae]|uniref:chitinase n=1 Tax=Flavobacterium johnsoniae (strain ATCC 17061 / DSM 2064 / JCM 8514 / BCRC 14874 / CCUG 350202 / NBRC 14942 / NCIMB 11054 / UW101) TaxID=376686 RepID=A5FC89_FLAJ1|nr:glycosyl hydrolase family 18 protein [Flavobacterium johnsoniae]ABQ07183.1 Candidate chitinase; Glycoside hydrolase family 18 [Flavobacterium johnsoniae UW101]OXE98896.1 glycoside hydrolase [Flavobacterium johnsoniae UW101]WQG80978.1 glycosyl hydrolase family 18 protein [Flavobacterium johnsoniae UW101]SHL27890.1 Por secretion system C-terminal sorting domain-containing protein [Flavobacterium johnsoniae]